MKSIKKKKRESALHTVKYTDDKCAIMYPYIYGIMIM